MPALDRAFDYSVPEELGSTVGVGTIVRVPLHGRRVRGWVVGAGVEPEAAPERLRPLLAAVSAGPPPEVVDLTAFAAWRWAGPRAAFLRAASPPNIVALGPEPELEVAVFPPREPPMPLPEARVRLIVWPPAQARLELVQALVEPAGSTIVIVPDPVEADAVVAMLRDEGRNVVPMRGDLRAAERTTAWESARHGACVVVGGRIAILTPVPDLAGVIVLDDADEALAEERAPAWHARGLAAERARRLGARLSLVTPVPTVEGVELANGGIVVAPRTTVTQGWPRLEVVDLRDEPPGMALLSAPLGPALQRAVDVGGRALCILNRRGRARLLVCRACGEIARCPRCDARLAESTAPEPGAVLACARCASTTTGGCLTCGAGVFRKLRPGVTGLRDAVAGLVPRSRVIAVDASSAPLPPFDVGVGTEALLHRVHRARDRPVRLVAFLDFDQELLAPRYRAAEQALWLLVRGARVVGGADGSGALLVQTRIPSHEVVRAAADGDPGPLVAAERERRRVLGFPPFGGVAELRGDTLAVEEACVRARQSGGMTVVGPSGGRALLRAASVDDLCDALASVDLTPARALGRLRVDVDPLRV